MRDLSDFARTSLAALIIVAMPLPVHAASLIVNGGFESGFAGWTIADQIGSDGTFFIQSGTLSPVTMFPVPPPPQGTQAAMTDAGGPGSHVLYQAVTVTAPVPLAVLSFDLFVGNRAVDGLGNPFPFQTPDTLDFATALLNQQARVDLLAGGADPFSVAAADVIMNLFRTLAGDPLVSGYTHFSFDVTALLNANLNVPLLLRFAEVDNVAPFQFGVDNISLEVGPTTPVQEPASFTLAIAGLLALAVARRRRASARQVA